MSLLKSLEIRHVTDERRTRYDLFQTYLSEARELGGDMARRSAQTVESKQEQKSLETGGLETVHSMVKNLD